METVPAPVHMDLGHPARRPAVPDGPALIPFGTRLRQIRESHRLSIGGLGAVTGYSRDYLSRIENLRVRVTQPVAETMDRYFGCAGALAALAAPGGYADIHALIASIAQQEIEDSLTEHGALADPDFIGRRVATAVLAAWSPG